MNNWYIAIACFFVFSCQSAEEVKLKQYIVQGQILYKENCANCHQINGLGLANLYPPIKNADYLNGNKKKVIKLIHLGYNLPMKVNGKLYTQKMPAAKQLTNIEIAEIVTYVYNTWDTETVITSPTFVHEVLADSTVKL